MRGESESRFLNVEFDVLYIVYFAVANTQILFPDNDKQEGVKAALFIPHGAAANTLETTVNYCTA